MSPPILQSPHPPTIFDDKPSGSHNVATIREAVVIADAAVEKTERATRLQWIGLGFLGAVTIGVGAFLGWCFITLGVINVAQAQTAAKAEAALEATKVTAARLEVVDGGSRVEISNLRKELADDRANTAKQLTDMAVTLQAVLREVKKK